MFYQKSRWLVVPLSAAMLFFAACSDDDSSDKEVDPGQNQEEDFKLASQIEVDGGLVSGMAQGTVTSFKRNSICCPSGRGPALEGPSVGCSMGRSEGV